MTAQCDCEWLTVVGAWLAVRVKERKADKRRGRIIGEKVVLNFNKKIC